MKELVLWFRDAKASSLFHFWGKFWGAKKIGGPLAAPQGWLDRGVGGEAPKLDLQTMGMFPFADNPFTAYHIFSTQHATYPNTDQSA